MNFNDFKEKIKNRNDVRVIFSRYRAFTRVANSELVSKVVADDILVQFKENENTLGVVFTFDEKTLREALAVKQYSVDLYINKNDFPNDYLVVDIMQRSTKDNMHLMIPQIAAFDDFPEASPSCSMLFRELNVILFNAEGMFEN